MDTLDGSQARNDLTILQMSGLNIQGNLPKLMIVKPESS
jgi:hypothetical protein